MLLVPCTMLRRYKFNFLTSLFHMTLMHVFSKLLKATSKVPIILSCMLCMLYFIKVSNIYLFQQNNNINYSVSLLLVFKLKFTFIF